MPRTKRVVGISLGTRQLGIALFREGELLDWRIHSFKYAWSAFKKKQILRCVESIVKAHAATMVAIKITEPDKQNAAYKALLYDLELLLHARAIPSYVFTLEQLKAQLPCAYQHNKDAFMEGVSMLYPELSIEYEKERTNHTSYYFKLFEAIAAARLCLDTKA